jgi:phosphoribosyl-AMP cyclohydrolase
MNKDFLTIINALKFGEQGLIPAIIQDKKTKKVMTLCYMNKESLAKTFETGKIYLFRRSLGKLMMKGETSGNIQVLKNAYLDCECNSLLLEVEQKIAACHAGYFTCYFREFDKSGAIKISEKRIFNPERVYKK